MAVRKIQTRTPRRLGTFARIAMFGAQSSGKTHTSLEFATRLCEREGVDPGESIVFVDTEKEGPDTFSSELFCSRFDFTVAPFEPPYDPTDLADTIEAYSREYFVVIVDSGSHFWSERGGTLDIKDTATRTKFRGNDAAGWSEASPVQAYLTETFHRMHSHLIFCMRSGNEWNKELNDVVGTKPVQKAGIDYEFTVGLEVTRPDHSIKIHKTRIDDGPYVLKLGDVYKSGGQQTALFDLIYDWSQVAEQSEQVCTAEQVRRIEETFELIPNQRPRNTAKHEWRIQFGCTPGELPAAKYEEALAAAETLAGIDQDDEDDDGHDPIDGETRVAEEYAEAQKQAEPKPAKKAAKKRAKKKPAKKAAAKKAAKKPAAKKTKTAQQARSEATPDEGEPWSDSAADAHETGGAAQNGSTAASDEAEAGRVMILSAYISLPGPWGIEAESSLMDAELWPISEIADEDVNRAANIVAQVGEKAKQGAIE